MAALRCNSIPILLPQRCLHKHNNNNNCLAFALHSTKASSTSLSQEIVRPLVKFPPNIWGDRFITLPFHNSELESCSTKVDVLKESVKDMLMDSTTDPIKNILMINSLFRLGVSYHFEDEIETQLTHCFDTLSQLVHDNNLYDLHTTAIIFQVFRSHGHNMSSDVFNKFKDENGEFKVGDVKGMISLYEAASFRINGEPILDDAFAFTLSRLSSMAAGQSSLSPHYAEYIENALYYPYHRAVPRLESRKYISFYEKDNESRNDTLLQFAKYDFNRIQMMLQRELSDLCSWWKEEEIEARVPYIRHRIVESFFLAVGLYFEPRYARARNIFSKLIQMVGIIDDTYEAYGTYQELRCFTHAMHRSDISAMDTLPTDNFKRVYELFLNIHDEAEEKVRDEGRSYAVSYTKIEFAKLADAYLVQERWVHTKYEPTFDEFLETALRSSAAIVSVSEAFIGMEEADETAYEWLIYTNNKIHKALVRFARLNDDIMTNELEEERGLVSGTICYMKQHGVTRQEATEAYKELLDAAWKDINEDCLKPTMPVSNKIRVTALNYARLMDVSYKDDDGLGVPETSVKGLIEQMLVHPIPL